MEFKQNKKSKEKQNNTNSSKGGLVSQMLMNTPLMQKRANEHQAIFGKTIQKQENNTGLPDNLKSGMEALSGMSLDHVKVHYNSSKPASVQAHAFAQGSDIHIASGQEKHLPHELGHIVQQAEGRVKPTTNIGGVAVNDSPALESEATKMGERALQRKGKINNSNQKEESQKANSNGLYQMISFFHGGNKSFIDSAVAGKHSAKKSQGELGSEGMYYWKDDENAALATAAIYNPKQEWAVMEIKMNPKILKNNEGKYRILYFQSNSVKPYEIINDKGTFIKGMHYKFLQENLDNKLNEAKEDPSVEGKLKEEYGKMTGRQFLDSFDLVISPTKAENYKYEDLVQVRANNTALNSIYGTDDDGKPNKFSKAWEGIIDNDQDNTTIVNMGLKSKEQFPKTLLSMNGKNGNSITKF